jgi:GNAT superfamily N-acetyltransferase
MQIRSYEEADLAEVIALWEAAGLNVPSNDPAADIPRCVAQPNARLFVGRLGPTLVGTIMCGHDGHRGWLYRLAVAPEHRRLGFGRRLLEHAEAWLAGEDMPKINLMIRESNVEVREFYLRLGYGVTPRLVMQKPLGLAHAAPGSGTIEVVVTYLEMTAPPLRRPAPKPTGKFALLRAEQPPVAFYRYLYDQVGEIWFWYERRSLTDEALAAIIGDPRVEIYVLYAEGVPAGYVELDRRNGLDIAIAYFGIMPGFIGRGFGPYLLDWAIDLAWSYGPRRLTVDTCTLDHPKALRVYQRAGFVPYDQARKQIDDPRRAGLIPPHLEPRLP